ncbi:secretin N-terminal domain-containing protein [Paraherbaspirillum soli]|uniref:Secretin N-terminal domain-containing protein n=1 Tax=Paraherbaspirillum soli TaxID=631222 RepID=A0ABW0MD12_9BURK
MKRNTIIFALLSPFLVSGCAMTGAIKDHFSPAKPQLTQQESLQAAKDDLKKRPDDTEKQQGVVREQGGYVNEELRQATSKMNAGKEAEALAHLEKVLAEQPGNMRAEQLKKQIQRRTEMQAELAQAGKIKSKHPQQALDIVGKILLEQPAYAPALALRDEISRRQDSRRSTRPRLADALRKPVSLNFKSQPMINIFDVISRMTGVDFVFDRDVQTSMPASIFSEKTTAEDAINLLLRTNQLEKKVLNEHTVLIYPARADKDKNYKEFVLRTFYLSHTDAKTAMAALRQMIKPKDVHIDERVNALIMRDTPEAVSVAERIIASLDIPQSEVTMDVQVLEVNTTDEVDLGVDFPGKVNLSARSAVEGSVFTLADLLRLNREKVGVSGDNGALSMAINMLQKQGKTKVLANPKIRVRNQEKANIKIGEKVPIITNVNANGVVTESINYQDVGLMLKVEPRISLNDEVSVKVNLEVSNILNTLKTASGNVAYTLGTRNAETVMTAKDGETQVLAGLIKQNDINGASGIPGLSDLPWMDRVFGSKKTNRENSEIVLLITPHVERNLDLPEAGVSTFLSGTESQVTTDTLTLELPAGATSATPKKMSAPTDAKVPALSDPIAPPDADVKDEPAAAAPADSSNADSTRDGIVKAADQDALRMAAAEPALAATQPAMTLSGTPASFNSAGSALSAV